MGKLPYINNLYKRLQKSSKNPLRERAILGVNRILNIGNNDMYVPRYRKYSKTDHKESATHTSGISGISGNSGNSGVYEKDDNDKKYKENKKYKEYIKNRDVADDIDDYFEKYIEEIRKNGGL
jgi:hypothetical protein